MKNNRYILWGLIFLGVPFIVQAISSTNYAIDPLNAGDSGGHNSQSANFELEQQQVGDVTVDSSSSPNYNLRHGHLYPDDAGVFLDFTVIPEKRIPTMGNNSTRVILNVYNEGDTIPIQSYFYYDTDNNGNYSNLELVDIMPGTYDIAIKGYAHLWKKISAVTLDAGINSVDFTGGGTDELLCGDVYVNGTYPNGDNTVNAVDITYLVSKWADIDSGASDERADVDENSQVNSLDMAKAVNNYGVIGD